MTHSKDTCSYCKASIQIWEHVIRCPSCKTVIHEQCAIDNYGVCPNRLCQSSLDIRPNNVEIVVSGTNAEEVKYVALSLMEQTQSNNRDRLTDLPRTRILFLAADPVNTPRLRLGEELREIQEKLHLAQLREHFMLQQRMSVRPTDISQALLDVDPQIVHFSGHGSSTGALCFENQVGETLPIQPESLAALFEQFADRISCVLLNACYSEQQANAIAQHIDYVIGMNQAVGDKAAIAFAIGFYQALGAGRTIEESYKLGCVQIRLQNIPEHLTPVLLKKAHTE